MKQFGHVGVWILAALQLGCSGCSGASPNATGLAVAGPADPTGPSAGDMPPGAKSVGAYTVRQGTDNPGHVFKPVVHPAHTFASYRAVNLSALPRLVQRNGCFAAARDEYVPRPYSLGGSSYAPAPRSAKSAPKKSLSRARPQAPAEGQIAQGSSLPAQKPKADSAGFGSGAQAPAGANYSTRDDKGNAEPSPAPAARPATEPAAKARGAKAEMERAEEDHAAAVGARDERESDWDREQARGDYHDWGQSLYLSNDDTMSLSSAQRVLFAIDQKLPIAPEHIRPHEFLNYFSFDTARVAPGNDFSVSAEIAPKLDEDGVFTLALSVAGRDVTRDTRRNAGLTFVIDRSGSMADEGRMEYLKQGLRRMTNELKPGDLVNLVLFDDSVCTPLENFVVGRDSMAILDQTIARLQPRGSTDLNAGLRRGYELANADYQDEFTNRVILISDALTNTGVTDPELISMVSESYDKRRVRLSGVGVGRDFNDELLDRLTEKGKGAYVFLGSEAEVDAVFGSRFVSLIETVANDVHFRLHLPPSLRMNTFYGEESSVVKSDVQAIHYFAGTNQLFLSDVMSRDGRLPSNDDIMLTVEYENPETGRQQVEEFAFTLGDLRRDTQNVDKGRLVMSFIDGVRDLELLSRESSRYQPSSQEAAAEQCATGRESLRQQSLAMRSDPEASRVLHLWDAYCARYPEPRVRPRPLRRASDERQPVRRDAPRGADVWPNAAY